MSAATVADGDVHSLRLIVASLAPTRNLTSEPAAAGRNGVALSGSRDAATKGRLRTEFNNLQQ